MKSHVPILIGSKSGTTLIKTVIPAYCCKSSNKWNVFRDLFTQFVRASYCLKALSFQLDSRYPVLILDIGDFALEVLVSN